MSYMIDERDVKFVHLEWLKVEELCKLPAFAEYSADMFDMVITEALKIAKNVLSPINAEGDQVGCRIEDGQAYAPPCYKDAYKTFVENGWIGVSVNPEYGGQGFPYTIGMQAIELFSGSCTSFSMYPELTHGSAHLFEVFASDELKKLYCEKMYAGQWAGTMCLTEANAGSDVGALTTTAKKEGDHYRISGVKTFISGGDHDLTENIIHAVLARVEGAPKGIRGVSLFAVPKIRVNPDGSLGEPNDVICSGIEHKMGIHGSTTCTLNFGENGDCIGHLIGEENQGIKYMFQMMNEARLYVGIQGFAMSASAYLNAREYAKERIQFVHVKDMKNPDADPVPIIQHPDVRRMLMFGKAMTEGMRALLMKTAYMIDLVHYHEDENERQKYQGLVDLLIPICKAYSTDQAFRVAEAAIQVYGGYGYCSEYPAEQYARDIKITSLYEGTNGIQALDLIGRKLAMKGGMLFMSYMMWLNEFTGAYGEHEGVKDLVEKFIAAKDTLAAITMGFGEKAKGPEAILAVLNACPYLEMFGHVVVSHLLIEQAAIAYDALIKIYEQKGCIEDKKVQRALIEDHDDAKFYYGKIQSATWFVNNMLPHVKAIAESIEAGDTSALKVVF